MNPQELSKEEMRNTDGGRATDTNGTAISAAIQVNAGVSYSDGDGNTESYNADAGISTDALFQSRD